jgi:ribosomal protein S18 acetylase RimI-like enzyme
MAETGFPAKPTPCGQGPAVAHGTLRQMIARPTKTDVATLERAVFDAVPPDRLVAIDGWLIGLNDGTVGRARSAVPLSHERPPDTDFVQIEALYAAHGLPVHFRLPVDAPGFAEPIASLEARGFVRSSVVQTMTADLPAVKAAATAITRGAGVGDAAGQGGGMILTLAGEVDDDWAAVFMGAGFDPVDGASRTRLLRRARSAIYAGIQVPAAGPGYVAVGFGCLSQGLLGVHGMRTRPEWRQQGHACRLIGALADRAITVGLELAYLQVESDNASAVALYERLGFTTAWRYAYWRRPGAEH